MNDLKRGWKFGAFYGLTIFVIWSIYDRLLLGAWNADRNALVGCGALWGAYMTAHELLKKKEP